jgi:DNA-binding SARP family transcriptional activator
MTHAQGPVPDRSEVFDHAPLGLAVFDGAGVLLDHNAAFGRMIPGARLGATCCSLFGCRSEGSPLAHGCLTELAREAQQAPLPEIRLDLGEADRRSVWVLAGGTPTGHAIVHARPGELDDRRRRTTPHWTTAPVLDLRVLGPTQVAAPEGPLTGAWLVQRPGQLLKLLVSRRHVVTDGDELATALWPDATREQALSSLRFTIYQLRRHIEPQREGLGSFITTLGSGYRLDPARVRTDADEFEALAAAGLRARAAGRLEDSRRDLHAAAGLYRGPFLVDTPYADWARSERDRLHALVRDALLALVELDGAAGAEADAIAAMRQLTDLEPLDLGLHKELLRMLVAAGRRPEAHERHAEFTGRWRRAYGSAPDVPLRGIG